MSLAMDSPIAPDATQIEKLSNGFSHLGNGTINSSMNGSMNGNMNGIMNVNGSASPMEQNSVNTYMNGSSFIAAARSSLDYIVSYYNRLTSIRPLSRVQPGYLRPLLPEDAPELPEAWATIQQDIERLIMPGLTHWQSPNFMAFFPASTTYPSMLAELYSAAFTAPAFNWQCSPAITELETVTMDWMAKLFGLSQEFLSTGEGGGVIQGSASEAVVTCMVAAREKALARHTKGLEGEEYEAKRAEVLPKLMAFGSEQAHSSVTKGARIAGVRYRSIHTRLEDNLALTHETVSAAIQECQKDGLIPFFISLTLGTTNTCAVDDFAGLSPLLVEHQDDIWTHVDAAWAGSALVLPKYQYLARLICPFARSIDINMHKWLLTNFDASCLFIRRKRDLTDALSITPAYLRNEASESGHVTDYRDWQIPLGRRFRSLKIWFVVRTYGAQGLRNHIQRHCEMGEQFGTWLRERRDLFHVIAGPAFALNVFAIKPPQKDVTSTPQKQDPKNESMESIATITTNGVVDSGRVAKELESPSMPDKETNALTQAVYEKVNEVGKIFITATLVNGVYAIRVVSANPLADLKHLTDAFEEIVRVAELIRRDWKWDG